MTLNLNFMEPRVKLSHRFHQTQEDLGTLQELRQRGQPVQVMHYLEK